MKAFLIDPERQVILPITIADTLEAMYELIGCDLVEPVRLNQQGDTVWVDEEGLLKPDPRHFFRIVSADGVGTELAGKGIVTGSTPDGNNRDAQLSFQRLAAMVQWRVPVMLEGSLRTLALRVASYRKSKS
jgi:hypothetical protein